MQPKISCVILDRGTEIGEAWRSRYDSLVLFTPSWYSSLPGLELPLDPKHYATKDEIADYLASYAEHFSLPVKLNTDVISLTRTQAGFQIVTNDEIYQANKVIIRSNKHEGGPSHMGYRIPILLRMGANPRSY